MRRGLILTWFVLGVLGSVGAVRADSISGADRILCTTATASRCFPDGECVTAAPWEWNIPEFIIIDLGKKLLSTTEASGENRTSPIGHVERGEEMVFVQGVEAGRAFSFAISETTGMITYAVATAGNSIGGFGFCTPLPVGK
jgi:hypothetical protein